MWGKKGTNGVIDYFSIVEEEGIKGGTRPSEGQGGRWRSFTVQESKRNQKVVTSLAKKKSSSLIQKTSSTPERTKKRIWRRKREPSTSRSPSEERQRGAKTSSEEG